MEYIFFCGVHGVGKTTLLRKLTNEKPIFCTSVSDLIRSAGENIEDTNKLTKNASKNQDLWKQELTKISVNKGFKLALDGHFCLLDSKGKLILLPDDTFDGTNMKKIVLKKENPVVIKQRIEIRDGTKWDLKKIELFQQAEEDRALFYSRKNSIPLFIFDNDNRYGELLEFI